MSLTRSKILLTVFTLLYCLNLSRFFYWQIIRAPELKKKLLSQNYQVDKIPPLEGKIYTQDSYPLATNQEKYQLSLYKPDLRSPPSSLISLLPPDLSPLLVSFQQHPDQKWITLPHDFDPENLPPDPIPGLIFQKINRRFYPEGEMAQSILKNLQNYYQKQLAGKNGFLWTPKDALGNLILSQRSWQIDPVDGLNLHLNLNRSIQFIIESALKDGLNQYLADAGAIIVLQSSTGQILGVASTATSPISDLFEPGSIFKPLVLAMALDSGRVPPDFICSTCDRPKTIGQFTINNWDSRLYPNSGLKEIIKNSDNVGMSTIIAQLGLDEFLRYSHLLRLDQKTGIDLSGETKPSPKKYWSDLDLATASFGQGIALTPLQTLIAFNALANNGQLLPPRVVAHFSRGSQIIPLKSPSPAAVFSPTTTTTLKSILLYAVNNGAVSQFKPKDLEVCGKSGTAQIAIKGGYATSLTNASYIGFSPCQNPKITMIVTLAHPKTSPWGSSTAAPIWFKIADSILKLL